MEAGLVDCTAVLRPGERIDVAGLRLHVERDVSSDLPETSSRTHGEPEALAP